MQAHFFLTLHRGTPTAHERDLEILQVRAVFGQRRNHRDRQLRPAERAAGLAVLAFVSDRIDLECPVELHPEPEVHVPQCGGRPAGDAPRRGLLRGLHARDDHPRQLAGGGSGLERIPRHRHQHAPQRHHRIPLAEIRRLPPSDRHGGILLRA